MSASQASDSRKKRRLEKEIEYKRKSLQAYKNFIKPKDDEIICVLEAKKLQKEHELKTCYRIQCTAFFLNDLLSVVYNQVNIFFEIVHNSICSVFLFIDWTKGYVFQIIM